MRVYPNVDNSAQVTREPDEYADYPNTRFTTESLQGGLICNSRHTTIPP